MRHKSGSYNIEIYSDSTYTLNSVDNVHSYKIIHTDPSIYGCVHYGIKIYEDDEEINSALIIADGGGTSPHEQSVIYEDDRVIICCSNSLFCLSIPELKILWKVEAHTATCYKVFSYKGTYIVHGELGISRISHNGEIMWSTRNSDIYYSLNPEDEIKLTDKSIEIRGANNYLYTFDYDSNPIEKGSRDSKPNSTWQTIIEYISSLKI